MNDGVYFDQNGNEVIVINGFEYSREEFDSLVDMCGDCNMSVSYQPCKLHFIKIIFRLFAVLVHITEHTDKLISCNKHRQNTLLCSKEKRALLLSLNSA